MIGTTGTMRMMKMPITIDTVEDAWLDGITEFDKFISGFEQDFFEPVQRRTMLAMFATMTDQEKEQMRAIMGEKFTAIEAQMKKMMEV